MTFEGRMVSETFSVFRPLIESIKRVTMTFQTVSKQNEMIVIILTSGCVLAFKKSKDSRKNVASKCNCDCRSLKEILFVVHVCIRFHRKITKYKRRQTELRPRI